MNDIEPKNYFTPEELQCSCCKNYFFVSFTLDKLNALRETLGFPLNVTSGYRCKEYNTKMGYTQTHASGQAVDIACTHEQAFQIISLASQFDFTGIGVKQKGSGRFVHLDDLPKGERRPRPHVWSY